MRLTAHLVSTFCGHVPAALAVALLLLRRAARTAGRCSGTAALLDAREFENFFRDSGYWDYFLLGCYDGALRVYAVYTLFLVSDFAVTERASWAAATLLRPLGDFTFLEMRTLGELLLAVAAVAALLLGAGSLALAAASAL